MVFYFLVYKDAAEGTARKIDSFRVGDKTLGRIDGVETFADLMNRPAIPLKELRFKGCALSKVPDLTNLEEIDNEGKLSKKEETLAETISRMKAGESLEDAYQRGIQINQNQKKKILHNRLGDLGLGHGRKPRASSAHSRIESGGSGHGRVKISPTAESLGQPLPTIAINAAQSTDPKKPKSCMMMKTLEESLNSCTMKPFSGSFSDHRSSHSLTASSGNIGGNSLFGSIEIRQYTRILGDNPACPAGPPIALGWKYSPKSIVVSVDEYEMGREPRREQSALRLSINRRETMLRAVGYSTRDLIEADRVRRKDQFLRERTVCRLKYQSLEATMEKAKRITHFNRKKKDTSK